MPLWMKQFNLTSVITVPPTIGRLGQVISQGAITTYGYDNFGYLASSTTPTGVSTGYTYDANGNVLTTHQSPE